MYICIYILDSFVKNLNRMIKLFFYLFYFRDVAQILLNNINNSLVFLHEAPEEELRRAITVELLTHASKSLVSLCTRIH